MAEVVGAVASVAALVKLCLDGFEVIRVAQHQGVDYEKLTLRLSIERARLYTWGQVMGLTDVQKPYRLEDSPFQPLVARTLNVILRLFQDASDLRSKYGCVPCDDPEGIDKPGELVPLSASDRLALPFRNFRLVDRLDHNKPRTLRKTKWIIRDRNKFINLVTDVRVLIDGLQDITKELSAAAHQEAIVRAAIQKINDTDTLDLVSEVCQDDYPEVSDAASTRADIISLATDQRDDIESWVSEVNTTADFDAEGLEKLSITELKDMIRRLLKEEDRGRRPSESSVISELTALTSEPEGIDGDESTEPAANETRTLSLNPEPEAETQASLDRKTAIRKGSKRRWGAIYTNSGPDQTNLSALFELYRMKRQASVRERSLSREPAMERMVTLAPSSLPSSGLSKELSSEPESLTLMAAYVSLLQDDRVVGLCNNNALPPSPPLSPQTEICSSGPPVFQVDSTQIKTQSGSQPQLTTQLPSPPQSPSTDRCIPPYTPKHECRFCWERFAREDELSQHVELRHVSTKHITDGGANMCSYCGNVFEDQEALLDHVDWKHLATSRTVCQHCAEEFTTAKAKRQHVEETHPVTGANSFGLSTVSTMIGAMARAVISPLNL